MSEDPHGIPEWQAAWLTSGAFSVVHDTKRTELTLRDRDGQPCVAKRFRMCDEEALARYEAELTMLCALSASSESFVRPLAHITQPPSFAVVLPFYEHGSMDSLLHNPKYARLDWPLRMLFCQDVVAAVQHCHKHNVIVRDVKPANMLVSTSLHAVMSDLELAKTEEQIANPVSVAYGGPSSRRKTRFEGTPEYMAPELLCAPGSQLQRGIATITKATDVYSVGISLMEIATRQVPYTDVEMTTSQLHTVVETRYTPLALHRAIVEDGVRPHTTDDSPAFNELCQACWAPGVTTRPSIESVAGTLAQLSPPADTVRCPHLEECSAEAAAERLAACAAAEERQAVKPRRRCWADVLKGLAATPPDGRAGCLPKVVAGSGEGTAGRRDSMEDVWFQHTWHDQGRQGARVFGMLDGHGGAACARFVRQHLPSFLEHELLSMETVSVPGAVKSAFDAVQERWEADPASDTSGACCTVALVLESHVWIAWCGDCSAVGCRSGSAVTFTSDHSPTAAVERRRLEAAGGRLVQTDDGKWRLNGQIAVSRAFGDKTQPLVSHVPDVTHYALRGMDELLVLATDGVWDVLTPEQVVTALQGTVRHRDYGAKRIASDAYNAGSTDNIGAMVIYFDEQNWS